MVPFSQDEEQLIEGISSEELRNSLALMRQKLQETVWAGEGTTIIQDFTDHGLTHIKNLARYAQRLQKAYTGDDPLTEEERYLLLSGIYMHDIGMQCDVRKFPQIKDKAVDDDLGAKFAVDFTAERSRQYSIDEQKAIRENHHLLSAAWIAQDYDSQTGITPLAPAIKSIPEKYVKDLMDVCKYHTKLRISKCPEAFDVQPTGRKRLVAAMLRFADELDIASTRVENFESVKTFSLDPNNEVYWWLHEKTVISFPYRRANVIRITIRLHTSDFEEYEDIVRNKCIDRFKIKNDPVITVLAENGIPLVISSASNVEKHEFTSRLPGKIAQALKAMEDSKIQDARKFTEEVTNVKELVSEEAPLDRIIEVIEGSLGWSKLIFIRMFLRLLLRSVAEAHGIHFKTTRGIERMNECLAKERIIDENLHNEIERIRDATFTAEWPFGKEPHPDNVEFTLENYEQVFARLKEIALKLEKS
jgi:hypothetical protein